MAYTETIINGKKVILDENGKPCRSCNTLQDFQSASLFLKGAGGKSQDVVPDFGKLMGQPASSSTQAKPSANTVNTPEIPEDYREEPPDSAQLGRGTWTFLHSLAANYPNRPSDEQKTEMKSFIETFARVYPCQPCAEDFQRWMAKHVPDTASREKLSLWMCDAHNDVNEKLGKERFDCRTWRQRWRDGWE